MAPVTHSFQHHLLLALALAALPLAFGCTDEDEPVGPDAGDFAACNVPTDCLVLPMSCCGSCGAPTRGDAIAVARDRVDAYRGNTCGDDQGCPTCAPLFIDPTLVATCRDQRCELIDLHEHHASACEADDDCRVRTPDCCPCGGDTEPGRLIGVSSENEYASLVCDPDSACPECAPVYPSEVTVSCAEAGYCETHDTRLPGGGGSLAACEVDGVVYPSGTGGIGDPRSCNTCSCIDGDVNGCTDAECPEPCPEGTAFGVDCVRCGPADDCEIVRTGCLPACEGDADCERGSCSSGVCLERCG